MAPMRWLKRDSSLSWLILIMALIGLLGLLAALQYSWLGQVGVADRERRVRALQSSAERFGEDFDRELARAFVVFQLDSEAALRGDAGDLAARYVNWQSIAPYPQLVGEIYFVTGQGSVVSSQVKRFDPRTKLFAQVDWPERLQSLRNNPIVEDMMIGGPGPLPAPALPPLNGELPALIIPTITIRPMPMTDRVWTRSIESIRAVSSWGYTVVLLDLDYLLRDFIPMLARRHFSGELRGDDFDYHLTITDQRSPSRTIFRSSPAGTLVGTGDAAIGLFNLRLDLIDDFSLGARAAIPFGGRVVSAGRAPALFTAAVMPPVSGAFISDFNGSLWRLSLQHRLGSLESAVTAVRRRNLAVGFGTLLLLAASMTLIIISTQRARRLAQQQLEFVAGVSHELRTPVSVVCMASANLSDGMIRDEEQVKSYGVMIHREGRRLAEMIEQILAFAGTESIRRPYLLQPVAVADVMTRALAAAQTMMPEKGVEMSSEIAPDLPVLLADAAALERAIYNLLSNAIKYGGPGRWVRLSATAETTKHGKEVLIIVEDRGDGIDAADLPHIFKPFRRGQAALASGIPGNGLGLCLVARIAEAHGGRIAVQSSLGRGSVFTLHLPARTTMSDEEQARELGSYEEARAAR
jgi:signal transduction histidine kinase